MQATLANWRSPPFNRWAFHHVRELIPSADIPNHPAAVRPLASQPAAMPPGFEELLRDTDTDGIAVLQRGRLVFERYANGMTGATPHILMSVSKSMLGLLSEILFKQGTLDAAQLITSVVPELEGTAYRGATIRHLLDMRAAIAWNEDYLASAGPIVEYRKASGWNPPADPPSDLHAFYSCLKETDGAHGGRFHYVSPNSDLLGWVIERATGRRYADLMSELVWQPAGAERSAYITVDRLGAARCAGGMCVTLRDLARVGLWMVESCSFLKDLETRGDAAAWAAGDLAQYFPGLPMRYRSQWYALDGNRNEEARDAEAAPLVFGFGIHGQNLFVDRANEIVVAKVSSQALPMDAEQIGLTVRAVSQLRKFLA